MINKRNKIQLHAPALAPAGGVCAEGRPPAGPRPEAESLPRLPRSPRAGRDMHRAHARPPAALPGLGVRGCQQSRRFPCPRPPGHRRVLAEAARKARLEAAGEVGEDGVVLMEGTGDSSGIGQDADVTPGPSEGTSAAGQDADVKPGPSGGAYAVSQDADMKAGPSGGASPPDQDADVTSRPSGGADADVLVTMADLPGTSAPKQ